MIYIDYKNLIYKTKVLESKPLLNIRDVNKGMTIRQEQLVRSYAGTDKNPKHHGEYLGIEDGFALVKSQYSDAIYKIDENGEMYDIKTGHKLGEYKNYIYYMIKIKTFEQYISDRKQVSNELGIDPSELEDSSDLGDMVDSLIDKTKKKKTDDEETAEEIMYEFNLEHDNTIATYNNPSLPGMELSKDEKVDSLLRRVFRFYKKNEDEFSYVSDESALKDALRVLISKEIK